MDLNRDPHRSIRDAADSVREYNHRTINGPEVFYGEHQLINHAPPAIGEAVGALYVLFERLPQAVDQTAPPYGTSRNSRRSAWPTATTPARRCPGCCGP